MNSESSERRNKSQFQKGMTLQQYLKNMQVTEETAPTADSTFRHSREEQQCLYKTSHNFYNHPHKNNRNCIKEIQQQNFQQSLDQYKDSLNIISNQLQPFNKRPLHHLDLGAEKAKNYRIRNGKSMSPYQHEIKNNKVNNFSPYKTFVVKKMPQMEKQKIVEQKTQRDFKEDNKIAAIRSIYGKQLENRKSIKNIKIDNMLNLNLNGEEYQLFQPQNSIKNQKILKKLQKIQIQPEKFDIRVETMKQRLQMKRKNKYKL